MGRSKGEGSVSLWFAPKISRDVFPRHPLKEFSHVPNDPRLIPGDFPWRALALLLFAEQALAQNPYGGVGYRPRDYYSARVNPDLNTGYYPNDYYRQSMRYQAPAYYYDNVPYYGPRVSYYNAPSYGSQSYYYNYPAQRYYYRTFP